jgi:hypothetical protein
MAKSALELAVNTGQWDAGLKKAQQSLNNFTEASGGLQQALQKDSENIQKFVRMMGSFESTAKTAKGQMNDYKSAIEQLTMQYNRMTDAQKKTIGQDYLSSIDKLKQKYQGVQESVNSMNKELNGGGGLKDALNSVAGQFGLNIEQLTKFGGVIAVTTTAVKVVKDAFSQSESNIDEWGRTVEGAKGAYDVFLQTINNGNWSNFFQNLSTAIQGARDLYDALDRLGSIKGNNQAAIAIVQQQIAQLRLMKQQGKDVDDQLKAATANLAALQKQAVTAGKNAGAATMQQTIRNGVNSMGGAYVSDKNIEAAIGGILRKGQAEFDKYKETVNKFENWSKAQKVTTQVIPDSQGGTYTKISREFDINLLTKEQQRQYKLAKAITERETEIQKGIAIYAQAVQEGTANAREEFKGNRYALQGSGGGTGSSGGKTGGKNVIKETYPEGSMKDLQQELQNLKKAQDLVTSPEDWQKYQKQIDEVTGKMDALKGVVKEVPMATGISGLTPEMLATGQADIKKQMQSVELGSEEYNDLSQRLIDYNTVSNLMQEAVKSGLQVDDETREEFANALMPGGQLSQEAIDGFVESLNYFKELAGDNPIVLDVKTGQIAKEAKNITNDVKSIQKAASVTADVVGSIGQAFNAIEDPAAKVMGTVMQSIATVALGYAEATAKAATLGPWAWIAFAATGLATMMTMVSSIHSATGYAEGGIIKGNSFSGDNIPADTFVNAGELVLNRAQQGALAQQLEGGRDEGMSRTPYVTGEQIFLGLNNYLKGAGYGQLVTSNG